MASEEGQIFACHTVDEWKEHFQKGSESKQLVVVDFTASWCGPCKIIDPTVLEQAKKFPNIIVLKVDVDELKDVATEWDIRAMPTFIFFKEGQVLDKLVGVNKVELMKKISLLSDPRKLL